MELVTMKGLLKAAKAGHYAVGGFNINGHEDAQGMIYGAEEKNAPIILMVSGSVLNFIGLPQTVGMVQGMAKAAKVPVCLHLDHASDPEVVKQAIRAGFSSVMIDASARSYEENIRVSREIVEFAKGYDCSVEAELGHVGGKEDDMVEGRAAFTNPADVPRFVEETGVDALAIAFGSVHGFYKSEPKLDFEVLAGVVAVTDVPLVLHGGTGIPEEDIARCIREGVAKVNVGTEFKAAYSHALRAAVAELPESEVDPKKYMVKVREACKAGVASKIELFGSAGKA